MGQLKETGDDYNRLGVSLPSTNPPLGNGINTGRLLQAYNYLGWDWRGVKGALSSVKSQGFSCNADYAFATIAAVESVFMIEYGYWTLDLSEQMIIDCSDSYGNQGCNGGYKDKAMQFARQNGLVFEQIYWYN